jgi:hypothetical protein
VLTRSVDMNSSNEFSGAMIPVGNQGTTNLNSVWLTAPDEGAVVVGTTSLAFVQLNGANDLIQGSGITISGNTISINTSTAPTFNQNTTGTAANVTGTVAIANGGTGQITQQAAINALVGTGYNTSGDFLRSNGTNAVMAAIQAADIPTNPNVAPGSLATNSQKIAVVYSTGLTLGGSTTITVTHNLNNSYPVVTVWNSTGVVVCDVIVDSANAIQLGFATAPGSNSIGCTVVG